MTPSQPSRHGDSLGSPSPGDARSRLVWMDFARGLCILLVILLHATAAIAHFAPVGLTEPSALNAFNMFFDPFRMPLLMFLSGMLLHKSLGKDTRHYVTGKFTQIFWPFLLFSMLILLVEDRLTLLNMLKVPISSPTLLWYLWFLVAFYMLALAFVKARVPLWLVAITSLMLVPILPDIQRIPRFAFLFFFFLAGHLAMTHMDRLERGPVKLGWPSAVAGLVLATAGGYISVTQGSIKYDLSYVWVPLSMAMFMLSVAPLYRTTPVTAWLEWVGRNSLVFYVLHFPVQLLVARALFDFAGISDFIPVFLTAVAMSLLVSSLVQLVRTHFWPVAALFNFNHLRPQRTRGSS